MKKVLVCGHRSYVATGFCNILESYNISFDCFSRGEEKRIDNVVTGDIFSMKNNPNLESYDTVINFIILKDRSLEENIEYIKSLLDFCKVKGIKNLIQLSSISVYPNDVLEVNEKSEIEKSWINKGKYAAIKVCTDNFLLNNRIESVNLSFVRPGFIYSKGYIPSKTGILLSKFGINILLGDKKTTMPLISRDLVHKSLVKIILSEKKEDVYLLLNKDKTIGTKYVFVKNQWNISPLTLPSSLIMPTVNFLKKLGILKDRHFLKFVGLFKRTWFNSDYTEKCLGISFGQKKFAIIGAGTYGSYTANVLSEKYPHERIDIYDVGDEHLKTEEEIGYQSDSIGAPYVGLKKARFFGYGGASAKWGGMLLFFDDNDIKSPDGFMKDIITINKKWKDYVYNRFGLRNTNKDILCNDGMFIKTGIWLSYFKRNMFKNFKIAKNPRIQCIPHSRVSRLLYNGKKITGFECISNGQRNIINGYDHYFLTAGAFESGRILINSGLAKENGELSFSDHLSQRAFKVTSGSKIGNVDFKFHIQKASLVTKRVIGEVNGYSFYTQPICNEDFPFFQDVKKLLYGHHFSLSLIWNIFKQLPYCFAFMWHMIILKELYIYKNEFYLQVDIEAPKDSGRMYQNNKKDSFGEFGLDVDLSIKSQTNILFSKAREYIKKYLDDNGVIYEELPFSTSAEKYEDIYHPYDIVSKYNSANDYFNAYSNMLIINTGILPRTGGINTTGPVFPIVEEYINDYML